jgi:hypothetical protein
MEFAVRDGELGVVFHKCECFCLSDLPKGFSRLRATYLKPDLGVVVAGLLFYSIRPHRNV